MVALTVAVLQTAVVPVLGTIADQLNASPVAVSWAVTANLLAAAAATPLIGRLADLHNKKHVLLGVLVIVLDRLGTRGHDVVARAVDRGPSAAGRVVRVVSGVRCSPARRARRGRRGQSARPAVGHAGLRRRYRPRRDRVADGRQRRLPPRVLADHGIHARGDRRRRRRGAVTETQRRKGRSTGWARSAWPPDCRPYC